MRQYAAPKSILYTIYYNAQNAHLAKYAAKCYKNISKFFPDELKASCHANTTAICDNYII